MLGRDLVYNNSINTRGVIDHDVNLEPSSFSSPITERQKIARMEFKDVGIPIRGHTILDVEHGVTYIVDSMINNDGNIVTVTLL